MNLKSQRRLAAKVMKVGQNKVRFNPERIEESLEALTTDDIRSLVKSKAITKKPKRGVSRGRARLKAAQKAKGRHKGQGKRSGTKKARTPKKRLWITKIRAIRDELKKMRESKEITASEYRKLYLQSKGNLFQSRRHLREHLERMRS
jgi:large subunit ribosomal protein L19e